MGGFSFVEVNGLKLDVWVLARLLLALGLKGVGAGGVWVIFGKDEKGYAEVAEAVGLTDGGGLGVTSGWMSVTWYDSVISALLYIRRLLGER